MAAPASPLEPAEDLSAGRADWPAVPPSYGPVLASQRVHRDSPAGLLPKMQASASYPSPSGILPVTPADTCSAERPAPSSPHTGLPLQRLNAHPRDARICFVEQGHIYFLDKATQFPLSVSGVWQKFFAIFDAEYTVNRFFEKWASDDSSKYYEVIKQSREAGKDDAAIMHQIKDGWTLKGKQASERGTYMHKQIELCLNARDFDDTMPEMEQFFDFRKEWMLDKKWEPWRTEWSIYDEHLMVAGQIDSIFKDEEGRFHMIDWKRVIHNLDKDSDRRWNRFGRPPLQKLVDNHWSHYAAQQNLYAAILADQYDIRISSMWLLQLHQDRLKFEMHEVDFFLEEAREMLRIAAEDP